MAVPGRAPKQTGGRVCEKFAPITLTLCRVESGRMRDYRAQTQREIFKFDLPSLTSLPVIIDGAVTKSEKHFRNTLVLSTSLHIHSCVSQIELPSERLMFFACFKCVRHCNGVIKDSLSLQIAFVDWFFSKKLLHLMAKIMNSWSWVSVGEKFLAEEIPGSYGGFWPNAPENSPKFTFGI